MQINTPDYLRPIADFKYPPYIQNYFEEWFYDYFSDSEAKTDRIYLPIFWTTYYLKNGHKAAKEIQEFIDQLDKSKKYFTVIQYDDGILEDVSALDLLVFSSAGVGDISIPLYSDGLDHIQPIPFDEKPILCSMIANNTNDIRKRVYLAMKDVDGCYITLDQQHEWETYIDIVNKSKFVIAPRGYGKHSFRFWEALKLGSVPVFVTDEKNIGDCLGTFVELDGFHKGFYQWVVFNGDQDKLKKDILSVINKPVENCLPKKISYEAIYTYIINELNVEYMHFG